MKKEIYGLIFLIIFSLPTLCLSAIGNIEQKLTASDGEAGDKFGRAVSISGDRLIVGAWSDDDNGDKSGSAYIFERGIDGNWAQVAKLLASDGEAGDRFGRAVSISGNYAIVGAYEENIGQAYIFERDIDGNWTQVAKLMANDYAAGDWFGLSVSISGDQAIVGAYGNDDNGEGSGSAYIFKRDIDGNWTQIAKLLASDGVAYDRFGQRVSISGDHAIIGAYTDGDNGFESGSAYIFERNIDGNWTQIAKLLASDGEAGDRFGVSVSISGNHATIGAYHDDDNGDNAGSAYIFVRDIDGNWTQVVKLLASDGEAEDWFGLAVSISGDRLIVGAHGDDDNGDKSGSAYIFERDIDGNWVQVAKLVASDGEAGDTFGYYYVSISENHTIIGAGGDDDNGDNSGSVYIFTDMAPATVAIKPNTLNLKSKGKWVTCYIELPEDNDPSNIYISTVAIVALAGYELEEPIFAQLEPSSVGDYDGNGIMDLMVKFNRQILYELINPGEVDIKVYGELVVPEISFEGTATVNVIEKGCRRCRKPTYNRKHP